MPHDVSNAAPAISTVPESELIVRVRRGDADAFEQLFRRYYDLLVSFADGYVDSIDVARDVVADVFVNVWSTRTEWAPTTTARTYLCGAVRNRALNTLRDERGRSGALRVHVATGVVPGLGAGEGSSAHDRLEHEERTAVVWAAIAALPSNQREAMMLRWRQQLSFVQIAEIMGISSAAVQMHLSRGLKTLKVVCPAAFE
jgi:RNA polymerase sigma-70 factor (ECF subfamily)